jgi:hypothetical protein
MDVRRGEYEYECVDGNKGLFTEQRDTIVVGGALDTIIYENPKRFFPHVQKRISEKVQQLSVLDRTVHCVVIYVLSDREEPVLNWPIIMMLSVDRFVQLLPFIFTSFEYMSQLRMLNQGLPV